MTNLTASDPKLLAKAEHRHRRFPQGASRYRPNPTPSTRLQKATSRRPSSRGLLGVQLCAPPGEVSPGQVPDSWRGADRRQGEKRAGEGRGGREESLPSRSCQDILPPANLLREGLRDTLQVRQQGGSFPRIGARGPDPFNTDKATGWLNSTQGPLQVLTATDRASGTSSGKQQPGRVLPSRPTGGWENRLKGIVASRVLSGGVTCRQKCPDTPPRATFSCQGRAFGFQKRGGGETRKGK